MNTHIIAFLPNLAGPDGIMILIMLILAAPVVCIVIYRRKSAQPPPLQGSEAASSEHESLLRLFIDKNYEYFATKWRQAECKKSKNSWNWAAFFLGLGWMTYRRMYLYSWIFIGVIVGETICELAFGFPQLLSSAINIGIQVTCGLRGNHWYKLHVEKKLRESAPADASTEAIRLQLAKKGGTNLGAAIGLCAAFLLFAMLANKAD